MAQATKQEEFLGFLDQCTVICLEFACLYGDWEHIDALRKTAERELTDKNEDLQRFIDTARQFTKLLEKIKFPKEKLTECLDRLKNSLDQETFNECADFFIEPPVESWEKVCMILHLICEVCEQHDSTKLRTVIQIGVRYMNKTLADFVSSQGGWKNLKSPRSQEEQGDISSSIIIVPQGDVQEIATEKVGGTAAYVGDAPNPVQDQGSSAKEGNNESFVKMAEILTSLDVSSLSNTDDERDSLATPPEIVERPLMTESYMQAMSNEEARESNGSDSNGFEIVGFENQEEMRERIASIDDVRTFEHPDEASVELKDTRQQSEKSPLKAKPILGGYLPHISIGIAAAAVAGFLVLRNDI